MSAIQDLEKSLWEKQQALRVSHNRLLAAAKCALVYIRLHDTERASSTQITVRDAIDYAEENTP